MADARHLAEVAARVEDLRRAVYAAKLVSYAQGFQLLRAASEENNWAINFGSCALMWRGKKQRLKKRERFVLTSFLVSSLQRRLHHSQQVFGQYQACL